MKKSYKYLSLIVVLVMGMSAVTINNDRLYEIGKNIEIFVNVYKELNTHYVDDVDPSQLMRTGIDAMVGSLDPYTNYISESQIQNYRIATEGRYDGIGAKSAEIDGKITIIEPFEGSPADKAGIKAGDIITAINGKSTEGKTREDLNAIVRGVPGTSLDITIDRPGKGIMKKSIERGSISMKNVPYAGMVSDEVGYISLTTFTSNASSNIAKELKKLKKNDNLKGVIIDLRSNGGGLLAEAINISNIFVPQGEEIVSTKCKVKERDQFFKTTKSPLDLDIPLAVMINSTSASASEIVSGVIQDLDRGVIIGQRSFGKGLVQNHKEVGFNNRLKVTTSKYYIPSGRCIQGVEYEDGKPVDIPDDQRSTYYTKNRRPVLDGGGVTPDVALELTKVPNIIKGLRSKHMIFKYVTEWSNKRDSIEAVSQFKFVDYNDFLSYLDKNNFDYQTESEKLIDNLVKESDKEGFEFQEEVDVLLTKIEREKENDLTLHKAEIINLIENDIATRFYYQAGKTEQKLASDDEIKKAIEILTDQKKYNSILKKG